MLFESLSPFRAVMEKQLQRPAPLQLIKSFCADLRLDHYKHTCPGGTDCNLKLYTHSSKPNWGVGRESGAVEGRGSPGPCVQNQGAGQGDVRHHRGAEGIQMAKAALGTEWDR